MMKLVPIFDEVFVDNPTPSSTSLTPIQDELDDPLQAVIDRILETSNWIMGGDMPDLLEVLNEIASWKARDKKWKSYTISIDIDTGSKTFENLYSVFTTKSGGNTSISFIEVFNDFQNVHNKYSPITSMRIRMAMTSCKDYSDVIEDKAYHEAQTESDRYLKDWYSVFKHGYNKKPLIEKYSHIRREYRHRINENELHKTLSFKPYSQPSDTKWTNSFEMLIDGIIDSLKNSDRDRMVRLQERLDKEFRSWVKYNLDDGRVNGVRAVYFTRIGLEIYYNDVGNNANTGMIILRDVELEKDAWETLKEIRFECKSILYAGEEWKVCEHEHLWDMTGKSMLCLRKLKM